MKRSITSALLLACALGVCAIPAKRIWKSVAQPDGTQIEVTLAGDENLHYYTTRDGIALAPDGKGAYCYAGISGNSIITTGVVAHEAALRTEREKAIACDVSNLGKIAVGSLPCMKRLRKAPRLNAATDKSAFTGKKKALVILASFSDKSFSRGDSAIVSFYNDMLNKEGFAEYGAAGSVHDYFSDMSRGVFDLTFDVVGPVRMGKPATYYGGPSVFLGGTEHIGEFITEAVKKADAKYEIDWKQYDWNGDGEVEQVFVLYAGYGQATGGPTGTIWPNAWTLDEATANNDGEGGFSVGGVLVNQYACGNELYGDSGSTPMGLGVFCHEFSHCMGLPDMYDTSYGSTPTMGKWDLLASGSYNGPQGIGWCPAGWTSYERAYAGWLNPIELKPGETVEGMTDLEDDDGKAYAIYNDNYPDEYYLLENHKNRGWDSYTPESGLLVIHVDYDEKLFRNNIVNTKGTFTPAEGYDGTYTNDHPRMAPLSRVRSIQNETYFYTYPMEAPRGIVDSLTDTSKPAATLYNAQADGTLLMGKPIYNIRKDAATGDISFSFMTKKEVTGIRDVTATHRSGEGYVYDLSGRPLGKVTLLDEGRLSRGIYIIGEKGRKKKVLVK